MTYIPLPPPPQHAPLQPTSTYIIDCINNQTYVWLWNGETFWYYPTRVESTGVVSGYRWDGRFWRFYPIELRLIRGVSCPPIPTLY